MTFPSEKFFAFSRKPINMVFVVTTQKLEKRKPLGFEQTVLKSGWE